MSRGAAMVWGLGIVALLSGLYWLNYRPHTYRYKMTVEVRTPQGVKSGSAVREVKWIPQPKMTGNEFTFKQRGEAVAVDLPNGQTLFALLDINGYDTILAGFGQGKRLEVKLLLDQANTDRKLYLYSPRDELRQRNLDLPRLARFRDLSDPKSVEAFNPDDLESSFGFGVRFLRVGLEITDEPVMVQTAKRLGWLSNHPERRLDASYQGSPNPTLSQRLTHGDFQRGFK